MIQTIHCPYALCDNCDAEYGGKDGQSEVSLYLMALENGWVANHIFVLHVGATVLSDGILCPECAAKEASK